MFFLKRGDCTMREQYDRINRLNHAARARSGSLRRTSLLVLVALVLTLLPGGARAQAPGTGAIAGQVFDSSGAVVTGARVSIVDDRTGAARDVLTNEQGAFRSTALSPGSYSVTVEGSGFQ